MLFVRNKAGKMDISARFTITKYHLFKNNVALARKYQSTMLNYASIIINIRIVLDP